MWNGAFQRSHSCLSKLLRNVAEQLSSHYVRLGLNEANTFSSCLAVRWMGRLIFLLSLTGQYKCSGNRINGSLFQPGQNTNTGISLNCFCRHWTPQHKQQQYIYFFFSAEVLMLCIQCVTCKTTADNPPSRRAKNTYRFHWSRKPPRSHLWLPTGRDVEHCAERSTSLQLP